jgi:2,4-dienoyl-CoA reductase-like NADH-dependent reductase (Old Yellow Enzyme family)
MRFPLSVVAAVREVVPSHLAFGMRVSATDWVDGGWNVNDTVVFARAALVEMEGGHIELVRRGPRVLWNAAGHSADLLRDTRGRATFSALIRTT